MTRLKCTQKRDCRTAVLRLKTKSCLSRKAEHDFSFGIQILKKNMKSEEK